MVQVEWTTTDHEFVRGKPVKDIEVKHQDWFWEDEVEVIIDKPEFAIGDYVMQQDGKVRGTIEKMKKPKQPGAGFNYKVGDAWVNEKLLTLSAKPKNAKAKTVMKFTAGNSNCTAYGPDLNGDLANPADISKVSEMQIAYQLLVTEQEKNLFCFVGTDIFVHDYLPHKKSPAYRGKTPKEKVDSHGLKRGSTSVCVIDGKWYFEGDFEHCDHDELKENARILRGLLEKFLESDLKKFRPYYIGKDYDRGIYVSTEQQQTHEPREVDGIRISQHSMERFRQYSFPVDVCYRDDKDKQNCWQPWETLDSYNPPDPAWMTPAAKNMYGHTREEIHQRCPVCANRKYLESLGELKPEVTGKTNYDKHLAGGYTYHNGDEIFALNWLLLKNKFEAEHTPTCKVCGDLIDTSVIFGCDSWVRRVKSGLCDEHDPEVKRRHEEFMREWNSDKHNKKLKPTASSASEKTGPLDAFFRK